MENQYKITFKKYREFCGKNHMLIPSWMNPVIFKHVLDLMMSGQKLQACKYLCDKSTEHNTRTEFGLKWAKVEVCDIIDNFKVFIPNPIEVKPITPSNLITTDEVREVLAPFKALADECLYNSNLHPDQIVYAYNRAQIKMEDLRKVVAIIEKMNSPLPADWFNK